jgi:hypothetical protein
MISNPQIRGSRANEYGNVISIHGYSEGLKLRVQVGQQTIILSFLEQQVQMFHC